MVNPVFSIIIPVLNSEHLIYTTLISILEQSFKDFEILIVDGLSCDNTVSIAQNFGDDRISMISEKDDGVYDAMNKGIKKSKGEWLYFIGAGDVFFDNHVLLDFFNKIQDSDSVEMIYGDVLVKGDTGWAKNGAIYDGAFGLEKILETNICHQSIFYKRIVFDLVGRFNLEYKICSDYDLNLKCFAKLNAVYFKRTVAVFNSGGISTNGNDVKFSSDFYNNVFDYYYDQLFKKEFRRFKKQFAQYGRERFSEKRYNLFFRMLLLRLWHSL